MEPELAHALGLKKVQVDETPSRKINFAEGATEHFTECYIRMFPKDPGRFCTCMDYSPEI